MMIAEGVEQAGVWQSELESLLLRLGERFHRREPRLPMRDYVRGLLGPVSRKNEWQLAEYAGHATPDGLQRLLAGSTWDADAVRDDPVPAEKFVRAGQRCRTPIGGAWLATGA